MDEPGMHSGQFVTISLKSQAIYEPADLTGSSNLMSYYGLEHSYNKFCGKKVREELSAFLPSLPGNIDMPGLEDNSSLRSLIEKPPIIGKELVPLSGSALAGFRLHPGPLPDQYKMMQMPQKKKKHKKHKRDGSKDGALQEAQGENSGDLAHDKKHKKPKRTDEEREKKKRKKEKKKKKKHSPEHPLSQSSEMLL